MTPREIDKAKQLADDLNACAGIHRSKHPETAKAFTEGADMLRSAIAHIRKLEAVKDAAKKDVRAEELLDALNALEKP